MRRIAYGDKRGIGNFCHLGCSLNHHDGHDRIRSQGNVGSVLLAAANGNHHHIGLLKDTLHFRKGHVPKSVTLSFRHFLSTSFYRERLSRARGLPAPGGEKSISLFPFPSKPVLSSDLPATALEGKPIPRGFVREPGLRYFMNRGSRKTLEISADLLSHLASFKKSILTSYSF